MASGISGFNFNAQFNFQSSFATGFSTNSVPYTGSNFGAYQTQQTAGYALGALGQLQGNYLDIMGSYGFGGNSYGNNNSLFPGQPAPFASFNNVFVPSGASPFTNGQGSFPSQPDPFASFNNVFVGGAAPFASFNNVFVPSGASPFASFNNVFVPPTASPFASFGGQFPGQPDFGRGTGAIALFPATQFIPFSSFLG